jgi:hypothetical protein
MRKSLLLLTFCIAAAIVADAGAQIVLQRFLPADGERGKLGSAQQLPNVIIGSRVLRMAPGAVIYDQSNRTIVHGHIPSGAEILFAREQSGYINRIYILTEREIASLKQAKR